MTSIVIPGSLVSVGDGAFYACSSLTNVVINQGITRLPPYMFTYCRNLRHIILPEGITDISDFAFGNCDNLVSIIIPFSVVNIGYAAFSYDSKLIALYFKGHAPVFGDSLFQNYGPINTIVYFLPVKTNWGSSFGNVPTALWNPQITGDYSFGIHTNQFGFNVNWASGMVAVVKACTNLSTSSWTPLKTNALSSDNLYFSDTNWAKFPNRYYRVCWTN